MNTADKRIDCIINGDCRDILKNYPDNFFDCVISDVPYLIISGGATTGREGVPTGILNKDRLRQSSDLKKKWIKEDEDIDNITLLTTGKLFENIPKFEEWLPEVYRVTKDGSHIYLMINGRNLKELQKKAESAGFKFLNLLVWVKNNATPNRYYMQKCEFILFLRKGFAKNINDMGETNVFNPPNIIGNKFHPTEKPVELMKHFIKQSTRKEDIVLDMFCGSGSTCVGTKELGRHFVGIEIEKRYADIAKSRLASPYFVREELKNGQINLFEQNLETAKNLITEPTSELFQNIVPIQRQKEIQEEKGETNDIKCI